MKSARWFKQIDEDGMQPESDYGVPGQVIRALRQVTMVCAALGSCLLLGAFVTIPILGFSSAGIGAIGIWCLLLAALLACLLLIAAAINRARAGHWYFGERDIVLRFVRGHQRSIILIGGTIFVLVLLIWVWLDMH
jgi:hypothetical protein